MARMDNNRAGASPSYMPVSMPKPPGSTWTDDQWQAIAARGQNTLVAAAAGSGKTAVLVERIIRRISDEAEPVDVDRLLVATFTKAAAAEMRERIREALEKALLVRADSDHLRRQLALLGRASITTLHSFCLEVVQRHIQTLPLDPGFRIANDTEAELMRQDALEEVLEAIYTEAPEDHPFWALAEWFSGSRQDDGPLAAMVLQLYEASCSHPEPERWLMHRADAFELEEQLGDTHPAIISLLGDVRLELDGICAMLREAIRLCESPGGPAHYAPTLQEDLTLAEYLREQADSGWTLLYQAFQAIGFGSLKAARKEEVDKVLQEQTKKLRDTAKSRLIKLQEELFVRSLEQYAEELEQAAPLMRTLIELVMRFGQRFTAAKLDKAAVDFSDLEHYALQVLRDPTSKPGEWRPSPAALAYREQFAEILLDEYQDTNEVQETIVSLIAKDGAGNRFLVGDVKQSIYRFRLAEPGLFLHKYKTYEKVGADGGRRIDLARNFRSRREVVDGVNFLFRQLMDETVGEIDYDEAAALVYGASYPELPKASDENRSATEFVIVDRTPSEEEGMGIFRPVDSDEGEDPEGEGSEADETAELETARLEARLIGFRIRQMMATTEPFLVFDKKTGGYRPPGFRDFVILLRATRAWAPAIVEELKRLGVPAYAELSTGYFEAIEVETVMSLLRVIDNPLQDIPMAAVLRSPIVGLNAEQLAQLRLLRRQGGFAEAVLSLLEPSDGTEESPTTNTDESEWLPRVRCFLLQVEEWRREARQGALSELIWRLFRETGYYDFVGGMPGGMQRQANLRALYDRARQYEATTLRGLFRFLRFMERMRDSGEDLGTARALGEQEDVVRIMTIHKSKGLEFPVVFVAGMAKRFNLFDLNGSFLLHKELGFGPKFVDTTLRVSYPMLPHLAIRRRIRKETLAEELRILYVALTRAREKLILVGTVSDGPKRLLDWGRSLSCEEQRLPAYERAQANSYLDWVGPAVLRHPQAAPLRGAAGLPSPLAIHPNEPSRFLLDIVRAEQLQLPAEEERMDEERILIRESILALRPVAAASSSAADVESRLTWRYPHPGGAQLYSKTTVTELKRQAATALAFDEFAAGAHAPSILRRPQFLQERRLTAAERGTAYHAVMQFMPLRSGLVLDDVRNAIRTMRERRLLTDAQANVIDSEVIARFFAGDVGRRLLQARQVQRELPFSYGLLADELDPGITDPLLAGETVLIQGVIDCLFETESGWVLLDYKTDATAGLSDDELRERYRLQLSLYARAIQQIWHRPLKEKVLFFFDGSRLLTLE